MTELTDEQTAEYERQISDAQAIGDHEKASELFQEMMGTTDAHQLDPAPLPAVAAEDESPPPAELYEPNVPLDGYVPAEELSDEQWTDALKETSRLSDAKVAEAEMRRRWPGAEFERNVAFMRNAGAAVPGFAAAVMAMERGAGPNHPDIQQLWANVGRQIARVPGDPSTIPQSEEGLDSMEQVSEEEIDEAISELQSEIERAQFQGLYDEANRLYQLQQDLYRAKPGGDRPAVGEGGRSI